MALIRRYSVQVDGLSGWYDVTDAMPRTEALAALKALRAKSKRERCGQTFRLHEMPSVSTRRKVANPSCKCSGGKRRNPSRSTRSGHKSPVHHMGGFEIFVRRSGKWVPAASASRRWAGGSAAGAKEKFLSQHPRLKPSSVKVLIAKRWSIGPTSLSRAKARRASSSKAR